MRVKILKKEGVFVQSYSFLNFPEKTISSTQRARYTGVRCLIFIKAKHWKPLIPRNRKHKDRIVVNLKE